MHPSREQRQPLLRLFAIAWKIWRSSARQVWWIILVIVLPVTLLTMIGRQLDQAAYGDLIWLSLLLQFGPDFILFIAWMAVLLLAAEWLAGVKPETRVLMRKSGERYIPGVLAFLTAVIARKVGLAAIALLTEALPHESALHSFAVFFGISFFSIVPLVWVSFFPFLTIIEERPLARGFRMSVRITHRRWLEVAGVLVLLFLLSGTVSMLIWWGLYYLDHEITTYAMKSGLSFYPRMALGVAVHTPIRALDQAVFLYLLTVFAVFFVNRRAIWPPDEEEVSEADDSAMEAIPGTGGAVGESSADDARVSGEGYSSREVRPE